MSGVFLEFGYAVSNLQSFFGKRTRSEEARLLEGKRMKEKEKRKKNIVSVSVGL